MEEGLDSGLGARVARVTVGLDDGEGLPLHDVAKKVEAEAVRTAGVVAAKQAVDPRSPTDLMGCPKIAVGVSPVDVTKERTSSSTG